MVTFGLDLKGSNSVMSVSICKDILPVMIKPEMVKYLQLLKKTLNKTGNEQVSFTDL